MNRHICDLIQISKKISCEFKIESFYVIETVYIYLCYFKSYYLLNMYQIDLVIMLLGETAIILENSENLIEQI